MPDTARKLITPEEYLEIDRKAEIRSEYLAGEMFAMSGGTEEHSLIAGNLTAALKASLRGRPCRVYTSDMRVHIEAVGLYTYPDCAVVCGQREFLDTRRDTILNPLVIADVLSPSTEAYDRGEKFAMYRRLPSLREYLVLSQSTPKVERFFRNERDHWGLIEVSGWDQEIEVPVLGCKLLLRDLYATLEGIDPAFPRPVQPATEPVSAG